MTMMYYVHARLVELLEAAYPDTYKKYKSFYIKFEFKEIVKKTGSHSKYRFDKKTITVSTLSRKPADILISAIAELAKHIDIIERQETHPDKAYLNICKKLIDTAIKQNMFILQDLYACKNDKLKHQLQEAYGSFKNWRVEKKFDPKYVYILVFDSFMIKNLLKANKYLFDVDQQAWTKYVKVEDYDEELYFISEYNSRADFKLIKDNEFFIKPCYKLIIETYASSSSDLLQALSYFYNSKSKRWCKNIFACELTIELEMIVDIPKQKVLISNI